MKKNRTPEEIADLLDEKEDKISAICQAAKLCEPECDCGEICAILEKNKIKNLFCLKKVGNLLIRYGKANMT